MIHRSLCVVCCFVAVGFSTASGQNQPNPLPPVVGASQPLRVEPDPAEAFLTADGHFWLRTLAFPQATFVKIHLVDVNLRHGDVLALRSVSGRIIEEIRARGPKNLGTFWSLSAFGDEVTLEFTYETPYDEPPFHIDQVIVGDAHLFQPQPEPESICSPGDFEDVLCYQSDAGKWSNVLASVGVMSVGGNPASALYCSGSNISRDNRVLTNDHCVGSQSSCDNAEFVFKYYRTGCGDGSPPTVDWESFRCDQLLVSSPFISCDQGLFDLDFGLFTVLGDPAATYGWVTPDPNPLTDGEAIYIVQHPSGRPHEVTHGSGSDVDVDGTVLRYYNTLDTEGGSSGSPIYRETDDLLIGLHHCGGCSTPGVGNRGMLMSDIYPHIEPFLCSSIVELFPSGTPTISELYGNGDGIPDAGETWQFSPALGNAACTTTATSVTADVQMHAGSSASLTLLTPTVSFGDIPAGSTVAALTPVQFRINSAAGCTGTATFDLVNVSATNGGPFADVTDIAPLAIGDLPFSTVYFDGFSAGFAGWTVVDGGSGGGLASTWTSDNPGSRSLGFTAPFAIADSAAQGAGLMDEQLISPLIDCSGTQAVQLQFSHDFNYDSGGLEERCDVDVRSSATINTWITVASFSGMSASGTEFVDVTAHAAGQSDVEVRFHYYKADDEFWWALDDFFVLGNSGLVCDDSFVSFGNGCAGTGGQVPELSGLGSATAGGEVTLQIDHGLPFGAGLLYLSALDNPGAGACQFEIGFPAIVSVPVVLNASGSLSLTGSLDPSNPVGFSLFLQFLGLDSGGTNGLFSLSNALDMMIH